MQGRGGVGPQDDVWSVGKGVVRFRACPWQDHLVATGGTENDLHVWDLGAGDKTTPIFQARNVKATKLDLRVPIAITDIQFMNAQGTRVVTGTALHQVRRPRMPASRAMDPTRPLSLTRLGRPSLCPTVHAAHTRHLAQSSAQVRVYDTGAGRRPVQDVSIGEYPIKSLVVSHDGQYERAGHALPPHARVTQPAAASAVGEIGLGQFGGVRGYHRHRLHSGPACRYSENTRLCLCVCVRGEEPPRRTAPC